MLLLILEIFLYTSLFGSVPYTLKIVHTIISNTTTTISILSHFLDISIFRSAFWTLKTVPNVVGNSEKHPKLSSFFQTAPLQENIYIQRNNCLEYPPWWKNNNLFFGMKSPDTLVDKEIYPELKYIPMPFQ